MAFNSLAYFLFLPAVFLVFSFIQDRYRWSVLLVASLSFYSALNAPYLLVVLGAVAAISFYVGLRMGKCCDEDRRKWLLWLGISVNILILAGMKYLPLLSQKGSNSTGPGQIIISIGVSYFTFQAISYLADIYRKIIAPETHFGYLVLSMAFFPKLLQGPIERTGDLMPQLKQAYLFDYENMRYGMLMFVWGLFKKVVVADRLALFVNTVYGDVHAYTGLPLILATYFYAFQIYFDFSGYTDMAIGTARMFNIKLTQNFNSPYLATSVAGFWRRWHISFSTWLRDYIYIPLGGSRVPRLKICRNLLFVFLICGLWHGASWGFVIWGLLHGLYLAVSVYYRPVQNKIHQWFGLEKSRLLSFWQTMVTFNLVCFAWIFFRANTIGDALYVVTNCSKGLGNSLSSIWKYDVLKNNLILRPGKFELLILLIVLMLLIGKEMVIQNASYSKRLEQLILTNWVVIFCGSLISVVVFGVINAGLPYIYFRF